MDLQQPSPPWVFIENLQTLEKLERICSALIPKDKRSFFSRRTAAEPMKPCILLIEDDQDMRDLVSGHLEHNGFDVQRAEDGIKVRPCTSVHPGSDPAGSDAAQGGWPHPVSAAPRDDRTAGIPILMLTALGGTKTRSAFQFRSR